MASAPRTVGIIGLGFGRAHIPAFQSQGCEVVAVCQRDQKVAREIATRYGVSGVFERWQDMLEQTRPDIVVPALQRYLHIEDRKAAEDLHAFHVPLFQKVPRPSFPGMQTLRDLLAPKYPAAASLQESDIVDSSLIDELERNGFIDRLYSDDGK